MPRVLTIIALSALIGACATPEPVITDDMLAFDGDMPADFSGSWERDYVRGDDINAVIGRALYQLQRSSGDTGQRYVPRDDQEALIALARLAEEITRVQVLKITQSENEISIDRKDDYAIFCSFFDGVSKSLESPFGVEVCGWDGDSLVSHAQLANGLRVTHRLTISPDGEQLRIITTVDSKKSRVPFTLSRFYRKFEAAASDFNCVETLSMKRVCSTGDLEL